MGIHYLIIFYSSEPGTKNNISDCDEERSLIRKDYLLCGGTGSIYFVEELVLHLVKCEAEEVLSKGLRDVILRKTVG